MRKDCGSPPKLRDMIVINDVAYGAADNDVIYREQSESKIMQVSETAIESSSTDHGRFGSVTIRYRTYVYNKTQTNTVIGPEAVNRSYLFISNPGEPQYMGIFLPIANGAEEIVGLAALGANCVIFTNEGIYTYDPVDDVLRTSPTRVGALSRDSIVSTERGIWFVGTDGMPRFFNGATAEELAHELIPLFSRPDYLGYYKPFDLGNAQEISGTTGDRKLFLVMPVSSLPTSWKPGTLIDGTVGERCIAIADFTMGRPRWSIDTISWEAVYWLGKESKLLGITTSGEFYFLEQGLLDEDAAGVGWPIPFTAGLRWFSAGGVQAQFNEALLDIDTQGETVYSRFEVDGHSDVRTSFTSAESGRDESVIPLPANFKGRYLDWRISGSVSKRVSVYGGIVEASARGVPS